MFIIFQVIVLLPQIYICPEKPTQPSFTIYMIYNMWNRGE